MQSTAFDKKKSVISDYCNSKTQFRIILSSNYAFKLIKIQLKNQKKGVPSDFFKGPFVRPPFNLDTTLNIGF